MERFSAADEKGEQQAVEETSGINKRKRRHSVDEEDDVDQAENKRSRASPLYNAPESLEDCLPALVSPPSINNVLSPLCDSENNRGESTPHGNKSKRTGVSNKSICYVSSLSDMRPCPIPKLSWADSGKLWKLMCQKDDRSLLDRNPHMLTRHPGLVPRMRAILLDWLIEVCEVYKLHRETYYLAVDYLDRYLSMNKDVSKTRLQLIGITCLFVASKVEEIYPPKIGEFAYVTDGACNEEDIHIQELNLLQCLNWNMTPITPIEWVGIYLQISISSQSSIYPTRPSVVNVDLETPAKSPSESPDPLKEESEKKEEDDAFVFPQFSGLDLCHTAQLMDLCSLDVGFSNFPYSIVAASAICHVISKKTALNVTGLDWDQIRDCVKWMEPFYAVILEDNSTLMLLEQNEPVPQNFGLASVCPNLTKDDSYKTQVHAITLDMFDQVMFRREEQESENKFILAESNVPILPSDEHLLSPTGMLTPPASSRKSIDAVALTVSDSKDVKNI